MLSSLWVWSSSMLLMDWFERFNVCRVWDVYCPGEFWCDSERTPVGVSTCAIETQQKMWWSTNRRDNRLILIDQEQHKRAKSHKQTGVQVIRKLCVTKWHKKMIRSEIFEQFLKTEALAFFLCLFAATFHTRIKIIRIRIIFGLILKMSCMTVFSTPFGHELGRLTASSKSNV